MPVAGQPKTECFRNSIGLINREPCATRGDVDQCASQQRTAIAGVEPRSMTNFLSAFTSHCESHDDTALSISRSMIVVVANLTSISKSTDLTKSRPNNDYFDPNLISFFIKAGPVSGQKSPGARDESKWTPPHVTFYSPGDRPPVTSRCFSAQPDLAQHHASGETRAPQQAIIKTSGDCPDPARSRWRFLIAAQLTDEKCAISVDQPLRRRHAGLRNIRCTHSIRPRSSPAAAARRRLIPDSLDKRVTAQPAHPRQDLRNAARAARSCTIPPPSIAPGRNGASAIGWALHQS